MKRAISPWTRPLLSLTPRELGVAARQRCQELGNQGADRGAALGRANPGVAIDVVGHRDRDVLHCAKLAQHHGFCDPQSARGAGRPLRDGHEINLARRILCGHCEVACRFDGITMGQDDEMSDYNRADLIFTNEMLLDEPLERTPLRNEGE